MNRTFVLLAIVVVLVLIATGLYGCFQNKPINPGPKEETTEETTVSPGPEPVIQYESEELPDTGGLRLG